MPQKQEVLFPQHIIASSGAAVSTGSVNGGPHDGLTFVYIATQQNPKRPLIVLERQFALLLIESLADKVHEVFDEDSEVSALIRLSMLEIQDKIETIRDACCGLSGDDFTDGGADSGTDMDSDSQE